MYSDIIIYRLLLSDGCVTFTGVPVATEFASNEKALAIIFNY